MTRRRHEYYSKLDFEFIISDKGKPAAKCLVCNSVKKNTAVIRLQAHRKICSGLAADIVVGKKQIKDTPNASIVSPKRLNNSDYKIEHVEMHDDLVVNEDDYELEGSEQETILETPEVQTPDNSNYNFEVLDKKIKTLPVSVQFDLICDIHTYARERIQHYKL